MDEFSCFIVDYLVSPLLYLVTYFVRAPIVDLHGLL